MPNCFQLSKKGNEFVPLSLSLVDEEICAHFNVEPHPRNYYKSWYDIIGYSIACYNDCKLGSEALKEKVMYFTEDMPSQERILEILDFMTENYMDRGWYEVKNHPKFVD